MNEPDELIAKAVKCNVGFREAAPMTGVSAAARKSIECAFLYGSAAMVVAVTGTFGMGEYAALEMVAVEIDTLAAMKTGIERVLP